MPIYNYTVHGMRSQLSKSPAATGREDGGSFIIGSTPDFIAANEVNDYWYHPQNKDE